MDTNSPTTMESSLIAEVTIPLTPIPGRSCQIYSVLGGANLVEERPAPDDQSSLHVRMRVVIPEDIMKVEQALSDDQGVLEKWLVQRLERMNMRAARIDGFQEENQDLREMDTVPETIRLEHDV